MGSYTWVPNKEKVSEGAEGPECPVWREWQWWPEFTPVAAVAAKGWLVNKVVKWYSEKASWAGELS